MTPATEKRIVALRAGLLYAGHAQDCPTCKRSFMPHHPRQRYCETECQQNRPARQAIERRSRERARLRSLEALSQAQVRRRSRERAAALPEAAEPAETRQRPRRPVWHLEWHKEVAIRPARPAPPRYYRLGAAMLNGEIAGIGYALPFQDDLNTIADHGSPGRLPAPNAGWARQSVLA